MKIHANKEPMQTEELLNEINGEPCLQYCIRIAKSDNMYTGLVQDDLGIRFMTRTRAKKRDVINDIMVFVKLFIDFTMGDDRTEANCRRIKNLAINKLGKFSVN